MHNVIYLLLRRMRLPLIVVILAYAISILGLVLIPGVDDQGNPWRMDFFHAFYFVSFTGSTIGYGEIPYTFTDAQRFWTMIAMYTTVIAWLYAIGALFTLFQDAAFRQVLRYTLFTRHVRHINEPFYLVCGLGDAGGMLVRELADRLIRCVVIEKREERLLALALEDLPVHVPGLCANAVESASLLAAGLKHRHCAGVIALTSDDHINLTIAITSKLLAPDLQVICRSESHDSEANMASFGTDYIIDPFDTFALHLATAIQAPCLSLLQDWLSLGQGDMLKEPVCPPSKGLWVVCGYGRFGKAVYEKLIREKYEVVVIEADPDTTGIPSTAFVLGRGTEAETLSQANLERAVGLVAGTDDDANNLSIIMTARALNSDLFVILRQNRKENDPVIEAVGADMVMLPSQIIANQIRVLLGAPLQHQFVKLVLHQEDEWACELISRISALVARHAPEVWEVAFTEEDSHAVCAHVRRGKLLTLADLMCDPRDRDSRLPCIPLMLLRHNERILLPDPGISVQKDDHLLFCGSHSGRDRMEWTLQNENALNYILTGEARPEGWIWRQLSKGGAR